MLEIAGGVILAVLFFAFLPQILILAGVVLATGLSIAAVVLVCLVTHEYPDLAATIGLLFGVAVATSIIWSGMVDSEWIKRFPRLQALIDHRVKPASTPTYPEREPLEVELYEDRREYRPADS